ncbi:MAG: hypothetical protein ACLRID_08800, partial [Subdoligranulum sp.]
MLVACIIADNRCRVLHKILYQVLCKTPAAQQRAAGAFCLLFIFMAMPHNSKCRYGERGAADAKP